MQSSLAKTPYFHLLLHYVYGALEPEATRRLTAEIATDERLSLVVAGIQEVRESRGFTGIQAHLDWLAVRQADMARQVRKQILKQQKRRYLRMFAWLTGLIGLSVYGLNFPQNSSEKLYTRFQYDSAEVGQLIAAFSPEDLQPAMPWIGLCITQDYQPALAGFNHLLEQDPSQAGIRYLAGFCYLEMGETQAAIDYFSSVYQHAASPLVQQQVLWQLGLAYLKAKDFDHAIPAFQAVRDGFDPAEAGEQPLVQEARRVLRRARIRRFALGVYKRITANISGNAFGREC
jgi:tetratricopeptide (TPR) repeat protein